MCLRRFFDAPGAGKLGAEESVDGFSLGSGSFFPGHEFDLALNISSKQCYVLSWPAPLLLRLWRLLGRRWGAMWGLMRAPRAPCLGRVRTLFLSILTSHLDDVSHAMRIASWD